MGYIMKFAYDDLHYHSFDSPLPETIRHFCSLEPQDTCPCKQATTPTLSAAKVEAPFLLGYKLSNASGTIWHVSLDGQRFKAVNKWHHSLTSGWKSHANHYRIQINFVAEHCVPGLCHRIHKEHHPRGASNSSFFALHEDNLLALYELPCNAGCLGAAHNSVFYLQHGFPFNVVEIDVSKLKEHNPKYCYTEEELVRKYGPQDGQEFGDKVQICGTKLPTSRALKFLKYGTSSVLRCFPPRASRITKSFENSFYISLKCRSHGRWHSDGSGMPESTVHLHECLPTGL
jgi:hypothetical protein